MNDQHNLLKQTRDYLVAGQLLKPGEHVLAAVSGGRDSAVMLHILHHLSKELGFDLSVAHFDHQLRPESAREQQFVRALAQGYGLQFYGGGADVRRLSGDANVEDTARRARYAFLRETAGKLRAEKIATAHHAQDQAETLLLHLLRGGGLEGLAAMAPLENGVLRPLLSIAPQRIEDYRATHKLAFCQDESNFDPRYLRNHIRLNLLPQLLEINPRLVQGLSATADICREDNALLTAWDKVALGELWLEDEQAVAQGFFALPPALQRRIARLAFSRVAGHEAELSFAQTESVRSLKEEQSVSLPGGWLIYRRGAFFIGREQPPLPQHEQSIPLLADGLWHELPGWGWEYMAKSGSGSSSDTLPFYTIALPAAMAQNLVFRTRRAGDAVPSRGKEGRRKLKDIFIEAKIPPYQRVSWPILVAGEQIIWLPGLYQRIHEVEGSVLLISARRIMNK